MEYTDIGRINKPHGLDGELKATIDERFWSDIANIDAFFVEQRGEKIPFFIEYLRGKGSLILKFEEVETKEEARSFTNKRLYLRREDISLTEEEINDKGLEYSFLEGYELIEVDLGTVGRIESVEDFPQQEMAKVDANGNLILIPLLKVWITNINKENKTITMSLPDGLLEV